MAKVWRFDVYLTVAPESIVLQWWLWNDGVEVGIGSYSLRPMIGPNGRESLQTESVIFKAVEANEVQVQLHGLEFPEQEARVILVGDNVEQDLGLYGEAELSNVLSIRLSSREPEPPAEVPPTEVPPGNGGKPTPSATARIPGWVWAVGIVGAALAFTKQRR